MPSAAEARAIYRAFLREGAKFPNYNIREYVRRRVREAFKEGELGSQPLQNQAIWKHAEQDLEVVKRQSVVYSLYARKHKSVMELQELVPRH